jgi:mannitol-1-phosphate 5-dehydrogenase
MNSLVQIGAGNIGRGFIGQLFFEAGYAITFVDVDERMICEIQRNKEYAIELVGEASRRRITVNNIDAINARDIHKVAQALSVCSMASLSVGVHAALNTVPLLIAGFRERQKATDAKPLNILVCENSDTVTDELYKKVREELGEKDYAAFCRLVAFVPASIGRMVPQRDARLHGDFLSVVTEEYGELPVDKDAWLGVFPEVKGMYAYSPFRFITHRKLYIHNMAHAMTAYLGRFVGDEFIHQSIRRQELKVLVRLAIADSARALSGEYGENAENIV